MVEWLEQYYIFVLYAIVALFVLKLVKKIVMAIIIIIVGFIITFYAYDDLIKPTVEDVYSYYSTELQLSDAVISASKNAYHTVKTHADKVKIRKDGFYFTGDNIHGKIGSNDGIYLDVTAERKNESSIALLLNIVQSFDSSASFREVVREVAEAERDATVDLTNGFIEVKGNEVRVYRHFK